MSKPRRKPYRTYPEPIILKIRKVVLDDLAKGVCDVFVSDQVGGEFQKRVLHIPTEIDYLLAQTIEGMGFEQEEVKVAYYEGAKEISFHIFPPEGV